MAERRPERVAHLVQAELATVFLREANDPRLRDLTVTAVRMSADLRVARVYVRTLGDTADARAGALRALARAASAPRSAPLAPASMKRRSRIPVRCSIHSSLVSISRVRS